MLATSSEKRKPLDPPRTEEDNATAQRRTEQARAEELRQENQELRQQLRGRRGRVAAAHPLEPLGALRGAADDSYRRPALRCRRLPYPFGVHANALGQGADHGRRGQLDPGEAL